MAFAHHRTRVERLLYGEFHAEDLTRLYLSMRMETETQTVEEIGHFIAHADERKAGVTTEMAKEFFAIQRFWAPAYRPNGRGEIQRGYNLSNLPPDFATYLQANFKSLSRKTIFEQTGLRQKEAAQIFSDLLPKFLQYANGRYYQFQSLRPEEEALLNCLFSTMNTREAFNAERLFSEFQKELVRFGYLCQEEAATFKKIKAPLSLFAIATMHGCKVVDDDGFEADLCVARAADGLAISATASTPSPLIPNLRMASYMFTTRLAVEDWCGPALQNLFNGSQPGPDLIKAPIELSRAQKLEAILPPNRVWPRERTAWLPPLRNQNSLRLYAGLSLASLSFLLAEGFRRVISRLRR